MQHNGFYSKIDEIRKIHPKMGKKWEAGEDERLKKLYEEYRQSGSRDFNAFLNGLVKDFERASGGLKARLAKYFDDIPDWDYGRDLFRKEELDKKTAAAIKDEQNDWLKSEYEKYLASKRETYQAFLKRVSQKLGGAEGKLITNRLSQLLGSVQKYGRADVGADIIRPYKKISREPEIPELDFSQNPEMAEALRLMSETNKNIFLTGEAGTGKSTLLQYFKLTTQKNVVVLAPTGVAAVNVGGQTIHSFCGFGPDITLSKVKKLSPWSAKKKLLEKLHTIIIDEISMVRADLLDCVDKFLRLNGPTGEIPFGGVQMVFIGDLYQLPPVEKDFIGGTGLIKEYQSPYFFDARSFKSGRFTYAELKTVYRQKDQAFLEILNAIRNNAATSEHLTVLNQRSQVAGVKFTFERFAVYLTPTNARAKQVNDFFLQRLAAEEKVFEGSVSGRFEDKTLPNDLQLRVKAGAQVMMLNNDPRKRWVNGTMGKIVGFAKNDEDEEFDDELAIENEGEKSEEEYSSGKELIIVELETGETVYVYPNIWEMFKFTLDKRTQKIETETVGMYKQYPLKLACALTIHKAQGKTFDKVCIDLATGTFAHGQLYVALSRCRTLEGLVLRQPVQFHHIIMDDRVTKFLNEFKMKQKDN